MKTVITFETEGDAQHTADILLAHAAKRTKASLTWSKQGNKVEATKAREDAAIAQRLSLHIEGQIGKHGVSA